MTMNKIQLHLISFFFAAILPSKKTSGHSDDGNDNTEDSYYAHLGVTESCTDEEIRKAYKKKSLQYHPDKIAQFASTNKSRNEKQIQADFFEVKEAYETLSDPNKRYAYDVLGKEGVKILSQGEGEWLQIFDYQTMMRNLARSSLYSKTKFMLLILFLSLIIVASPTLICLKVDGRCGMQDVRWVWVFMPIWFLNAIILLYTLSSQRWLKTLKMVCITTGELLLTLRWDDVISWDYVILLTPLYLLLLTILVKDFLDIRSVRKNLDRTVTISYLEEHILPIFREERLEENSDRMYQWCSYNNLTDRERDIINKEYIIINDQFEFDDVSNESIEPERKLFNTIMMSPEYKAAVEVRSRAICNIVSNISRMAFLILLVLKLDRDENWNWFLVFVPIWFQVSFIVFPSCWIFCCHGVIQEEIVRTESVGSVGLCELSDRSIETDCFFDDNKGSVRAKEENDDAKTNNRDVSIEDSSVESRDHNFVSNPSIASSKDKSSAAQDLDSDSMEKQARAFITTGAYGVFAVFLIFLVIKLNGAEDEIDSWSDYSALWVALPLLLVLVMLLFCICLCVCFVDRVEPLETMVASRRPSSVVKDNSMTLNDEEGGDSDIALQGFETKANFSDDSDDLD